MDCIPPISSVHGISQARILEWVAISFSRGSSQSRDQTRISCIAGRFFTNWAMTLWTAATQASLSFTISWSLLKLMSIELMRPSNHRILCRPLLLLPSIFPSIRVFSSESSLHIKWTKYWSFSFRLSVSNEYLGLIFFRTDWFYLLAVQGTLKSSPTLQFKSINSLALSFLYSPTLTSIYEYWKNHSLD